MSLEINLTQFGFDEKKARVYLALLELGTAKAFDIAQKARVERPTAYDILNKLVQEGLVSFMDRKGIRYYAVEDPQKIKQKLREKERLFEHLLPELQSIHNSLKAKPKIRYYEGVEGIKTVIEDTLSARDKKLCGILSITDLFKIPGKDFMLDYVDRRIKSGIYLRVIRSKLKEVKEYWPTSTAALRERRYAPEPMVFTMTTYIYNNKVSLISSKRENFGMIMESEEYRENMQNLFESLWQISTPM